MKPPAPQHSFWSIGELLRTANVSEQDFRKVCDALNIESACELRNGVEWFTTPVASLILSTINEARKKTTAIVATADTSQGENPKNLAN